MVGKDQRLYTIHRGNNNTWIPNGGESLNGSCTSRPIAVSYTDGRIDLVVRGGDARLWHIFYDRNQNQKWSEWILLGDDDKIKGGPDAVVLNDGSGFMVFAWGAKNGTLLSKRFNSNTKTWVPKDGFRELGAETLGGSPKAVASTDGVWVFAYDMEDNVVMRRWNQEQDSWTPGVEEDFSKLGIPQDSQRGTPPSHAVVT